MKAFFSSAILAASLLIATAGNSQQDKSQRPSPPRQVVTTLDNGYEVKLDYSAPSLKGRTIGTSVEPMKGKVWRMGANEATTISVNHDFSVNGQNLKAGTYSLFGLWNDDNTFTVIFNGATGIWGTTYEKNKDKDVLQTRASMRESNPATEQLTYTVETNGKVTLLWGNYNISFTIKKPV